MVKPIDIIDNVHIFMKNRRKYIGYTLKEVASQIGTSVANMYYFEHGKHKLNCVFFLKLCCILAVDLHDVLTTTRKEEATNDSRMFTNTLAVVCRILRECCGFNRTDLFFYQHFMFILEHDYYIRNREKLLGHKYIKCFTGITSPTALLMIKHFSRADLIKTIANNYTGKRGKANARRFKPNELLELPKPTKHVCDFMEEYTPWIYRIPLVEIRKIIDASKSSMMTFLVHGIEYDFTGKYCSETFLYSLSKYKGK